MAAIRVNGMTVFTWMEWISETFARDCEVDVWHDEPSRYAKKTVNEKNISETFACERSERIKVNVGH